MPSQFGQLIEGIVATITGHILGASAAADYLSAKRYVSSIQRTEKRSEQAALTIEQQKEALQEQAASDTAKQAAAQQQIVIKTTILAISVLFVAVVIGLIAFYYAVGKDET